MTLSSQCCNRCSAFFQPVSRTQSLCEGCSPRSTPPPVHAGASQETSAPPEREGVPIPAGILGHPRSSVGVRPDSAHFDLLSGEAFVSISGPGFCFPRLRVARKPDGSGFDLFDEAPATPAPFNPAYQGGLHRWPLDLGPEAALHGKEPCHE